MKNAMMRLGIPVLAVLGAGCTTMGTGFGTTATRTSAMTFNWKSSDAISGSMTATATDGKSYSGEFFQVTSDTTVDNLGPLWAGWGPGWRHGGWYDWDPGPQFITRYTGRVVANLASPDGAHVRCRFQLVHPSEGMGGGGKGECQLPGGNTIEATFPKA